jgi:hypothetical protein
VRARLAATGKNERAAPRLLCMCRHGVRKRCHHRLRGRAIHRAYIGTRHRIHRPVVTLAALIDAPPFERGDVRFVEIKKTLIGKLRWRTQFARRERGVGSAQLLEMRFHRGKCVGQRQRPEKTRTLDFKTRLGRHTAGILEYRFDITVVTCCEHGDFGHRLSSF